MSESAEREEGARVVCPNCGHANPELRHFCARCGAPLSSLSTIGPAETPLAEGYAYRQAVSGPPKKVVLVGMWMLFGPLLAVAVYLLASILGDFRFLGSGLESAGMVVGLLFMGAISGSLLLRTTLNFMRRKKDRGELAKADDP